MRVEGSRFAAFFAPILGGLCGAGVMASIIVDTQWIGVTVLAAVLTLGFLIWSMQNEREEALAARERRAVSELNRLRTRLEKVRAAERANV